MPFLSGDAESARQTPHPRRRKIAFAQVANNYIINQLLIVAAGAGMRCVYFEANSIASSRRSLPQNISFPTKNVGAPKIPRRAATSVRSRSRSLLGSACAWEMISRAGS
jgi:hypothetical protein